MQTKPTQDSLDYAEYLLERASFEDYKPAKDALKNSKDADWDEATAQHYQPDNSKIKLPKVPFRLALVAFVLIRIVAHTHNSSDSTNYNYTGSATQKIAHEAEEADKNISLFRSGKK